MTLLSPPHRLMNATLRRVADELAAFVKAAVLYGNRAVPNAESRLLSWEDLKAGLAGALAFKLGSRLVCEDLVSRVAATPPTAPGPGAAAAI